MNAAVNDLGPWRRRFALGSMLLVSGWFSAARSLPLAAAELYVGAATVDITPDKPVALDGQRRVRISKTPTTHIYASEDSVTDDRQMKLRTERSEPC